MEQIDVIQAGEQKNGSSCSNCSFLMGNDDVYCHACGFPEKGTDQERAKFHAKNAIKKNKHFDAYKKVKSARTTLYIVGGVTLVAGIGSYLFVNDIALMVTNIIVASIYGVLGYWSNKKPLAALLSGFLLYITVLVINGVVEPESLYKGIIWKVLILTYLGKGLYSAKAAQSQIEESSVE